MNPISRIRQMCRDLGLPSPFVYINLDGIEITVDVPTNRYHNVSDLEAVADKCEHFVSSSLVALEDGSFTWTVKLGIVL